MRDTNLSPSRLPEGYRGINHETLGSDIIAVIRCVEMPKLSFGEPLVKRIEALDPNGWYPIALLLEAMSAVERLGEISLRQMGKVLFKLSHGGRAPPKSARDVIYGVDAMYHYANRGQDIGGWTVLSFGDREAELKKNTPHHCVMEEGILLASLAAAGVQATVRQVACFRRGAGTCRFVIQAKGQVSDWA